MIGDMHTGKQQNIQRPEGKLSLDQCSINF